LTIALNAGSGGDMPRPWPRAACRPLRKTADRWQSARPRAHPGAHWNLEPAMVLPNW